MSLCHYVIVRNDIPLGTVCAMICHASGESASLYEDPIDGRFRGATAVVLSVNSEKELKRVDRKLFRNNIPRVVITESDAPHCGAWMAIGVVPVERETVSSVLREFQTIKTVLDNPVEGA